MPQSMNSSTQRLGVHPSSFHFVPNETRESLPKVKLYRFLNIHQRNENIQVKFYSCKANEGDFVRFFDNYFFIINIVNFLLS
jgi:hypothetical protein